LYLYIALLLIEIKAFCKKRSPCRNRGRYQN